MIRRSVTVAACLFFLSCCCSADAAVILSASAAGNGAVLDNFFPGVSMSEDGNHVYNCGPGWFGSIKIGQGWATNWFSYNTTVNAGTFIATFDVPVQSVSVVVSRWGGGVDGALLTAYDSAGTKIGQDIDLLNPDDSLDGITSTANLSIESVGPIASIRIGASGWDNTNVGFREITLGSDPSAVPEPATLAIWGTLGGLGLIAARRRKRIA